MANEKALLKWQAGIIQIPIGNIIKVKTNLSSSDKFGTFKVRCGIQRYSYTINPGIYAVGSPNEASQVLVTANYKLTFDALRSNLSSGNYWILVLDTKGINVWCAASKGTFGTDELINRIKLCNLDQIVNHKNIIVPQLGASGVAAHIVKSKTGFNVIYGPVRAKDIENFITSAFTASPSMREVTFNFMDRLVLTPVEIIFNSKYIPFIIIIFIIFNSIEPNAILFRNVLGVSFYNSVAYIAAIFIGSFIFPILLPYLPFRSFALNGALLGILWSIFCIIFNNIFCFQSSPLVAIANLLIITSILAFICLNFTGSTNFTSLSGVEKETKYTLPMAIGAFSLGILLFIIYKILMFAAF